MASTQPKNKGLREHYILGVYHSDSLKQITCIKASGMQMLLSVIGFVFLLILAVVLLIIYTPLREFIPGYPNAKTREIMINNALRADSLEGVIHLWEVHLVNLQRVLADKEPLTPEEMLPRGNTAQIPEVIAGGRSKEDSLLREEAETIEKQYELNVRGSNLQIEGLHFFPPVKGLIVADFSPAENHYAVDVVAPENSVISAVLDGTVNFASWTEEYGYVIQIQHENNLLSIYKHCSELFKKVGDQVTAGSAVAVIGGTGTISTGQHLHFELWHKGIPLNPVDYINF